jgi:hypothetical protein
MARGGIGSFAPVEESVLAGHALVWLALSARHPVGATHASPFLAGFVGARHASPLPAPTKGDGPMPIIHAAAVTELHQTEHQGVHGTARRDGRERPDALHERWRKVCVIVACGGSDMPRWLHLIEKIEDFARAEGCAATRIIGRKGWARVLAQYRTTRIVLEKELR